MLLRMRVSIPDLRGWLARVARSIAIAGADVVQVVVVERQAGRAVDDFTLFCADPWAQDRLVDALAELPNVTVEGIWPTSTAPDLSPELDLLARIVADPESAATAFVDGLPTVAAADWAAHVDGRTGAVRHATPTAPEVVPALAVQPRRAMAYTGEGGHGIALVPFGRPDSIIMIVRVDGPSFHPAELNRLDRLVEITMAVARLGAPAAIS